MRSIDFSQVLFEAIQYSGNDRHTITDQTFAQFRDFCSTRLKEAWEKNQWPDVVRFAPFTAVIDSDGVNSFTPVSDADEVIGCWKSLPLASTRAIPVPYIVTDSGSNTKIVISTLTDSGWYQYRTKCPKLTGDLYDSSIVYYKDAQIYFDSGSGTGSYTPVIGRSHIGNFYKCLTDSTIAGQNPNNTPSAWEKIQIPYVFGSYMSWGACANWQISEGLVQEAVVIEQKANQILEDEFDKLQRQQAQNPRLGFIGGY